MHNSNLVFQDSFNETIQFYNNDNIRIIKSGHPHNYKTTGPMQR